MFPVVALDIETTGLDPQRDAIIEIGAVKHDGIKIIDKWQRLINPRRGIPEAISQLTGITNQMVASEEPLSAVIDDFSDFVGDLPVIGHNIAFDLSFLKLHMDFSANPIHDTFEIASVVLPTASRYSLASLVNELELTNLSPHRAGEDAAATMAVFLKLLDEARDLPVSLIAEIVKSSKRIRWNGKWFFVNLLQEKSKQPIQARKAIVKPGEFQLGPPDELLAPPLKANQEVLPLDIEAITEVLSPGGHFSKYLDNFESRNEQIEMLQAVATAISTSQHLMVEAGTGIGKSYAYLVPASIWATQNNMRVVISTNTINLQHQLIDKDIPDVRKALSVDLKAAVLKGRNNYLCPRRLKAMQHRKLRDATELRVLSKVLVWLSQGGSGHLNDVTITGPAERDVWARISAQDEMCNMETCVSRMDGVCPYFKARQAALSAHILIVNHALLLSDVVTNNRVLPEYKYLIIDEAHHLEDASTGALHYRVTRREIERLFTDLGGIKSGILGRANELVETLVKPSDRAGASEAINSISDLAFRTENMFRTFFSQVDTFLEEQREGREIGEYGQKVRVIPATQTLPIWSDMEIAWDNTAQPMDALHRKLDQFHRDLVDALNIQDEESEVLFGEIAGFVRRLQEIYRSISAMVFELDPDYIYWIEVDYRFRKLSLNFAPLHIGNLMENHIWHPKESVILTSATLTANEQFDYLRNRLNADEADELVMGSPFDYENSALLFLPLDMPEPIEYRNYMRFLTRTILQTAKATGGRMLVLFTSYKQLRSVSNDISPILMKENIHVLEQGRGASASALLSEFKNSKNSVLLGTRSFWEGVDVPGDALSVLVIAKLPFDVPSDPIIAARSETFENPFGEYALPEAILKFRQGFGRLIRTQSDRGVVAVLDSRVRTKQYGQQFLHSIPECHLVEGSIEELPQQATRWLNI